MQWTTGDYSGGWDGLGGTEAVVGINAGDLINFITVPGSRTPNIINIINRSNIDIPGVWMFKVDECMYNSYICICALYILCMYHFAWADQREKQGYI